MNKRIKEILWRYTLCVIGVHYYRKLTFHPEIQCMVCLKYKPKV